MFFPVVIATVLLTIIGMTVGFLLGEKRNRRVEVSSSPSPTRVVTGPLCPPQTQETGARQGATGSLHEVLRVRTSRDMVVWICMDQARRLYYHANQGGTEAEWVEGETALFVSGVRRDSRGRYVGETADGNVVSVDRKRLLIRFANGRRQEQKVVGD